MKNTNKTIKTRIDIINRKARELKQDDWPELSDQVHDLHKYIVNFMNWFDDEIKTQSEIKARQNAQAIIDAGFEFDRIVINKVSLTIENGDIVVGDPDEGIPF